MPADHADPVLPTPTMVAATAARSPAPQLKPEKKIFLAIQGGQDPADIVRKLLDSCGCGIAVVVVVVVLVVWVGVGGVGGMVDML